MRRFLGAISFAMTLIAVGLIAWGVGGLIPARHGDARALHVATTEVDFGTLDPFAVVPVEVPAHETGSSSDVRDAIAGRLARLQHLSMDYRQYEETVIRATGSERTLPPRVRRDDAPREKECRVVYREGSLRLESRITEDYLDKVRSGEIAGWVETIFVFTPEYYQQLVRSHPDRDYSGNIREPWRLPINLVVDCALGLRLAHDDWNWIDQETVSEMKVEISDQGDVHCTLVDENGQTHRWLFREDLGFALVRYSAQPSIVDYETLVIENSEFRNSSGLMLPYRIIQRRFLRIDGAIENTHVISVEIHSYDIGADRNGEEPMAIVWPEGVRVYDSRFDTWYRADQDGTLHVIPSRESATNERSQSPAIAQDTRSSSSTGEMLTILGGMVAACIAFILNRSVGSLTRHAALCLCAATGVSIMIVPSGNALEGLHSGVQDGDGVKSYEQILQERGERRASLYQETVRRVVERLVRDAGLNADQAELCHVFFAGFLEFYHNANARYVIEIRDWRDAYLTERQADDPDIVQMPSGQWARRVEPIENDEVGRRTVQYLPMLNDESYMRIEQAESVRLRREIGRQQREAAQRMFQDIEAVLDDSQLPRWGRARQRLDIVLHDALHPRTGGRPNWHIDALGLLEEACREGGELEPFAPALLHPFSYELDVADDDPDLERIALLVERFEVSYLYALQATNRRNHARGVWEIRLALERDIKALAAEWLGPEAAVRWEDRFHERCNPWLFEADRVDAIVSRLGLDQLPSEVRDQVEPIVAQYELDRRRLRHRLSRVAIDLRTMPEHRRARLQAEFDRLHNEARPQLEHRTVHLLQIILTAAGIDLTPPAEGR